MFQVIGENAVDTDKEDDEQGSTVEMDNGQQYKEEKSPWKGKSSIR